MAISTLSKLTVPLATDQSASAQGLLMPKLQYRFRVTFVKFGRSVATELTKQVIDCTRPSVSHETITLDVYNSKIFLAGKHTWQPITINIRDDATGQVQLLVGEQLQKQLDHWEQSSAASGIDYKFSMLIEILDGGNGAFSPTVLETWEVDGCYLQETNYNQLAYSANEPCTISLTVQMDNAVQIPQGKGVGVNVGRTQGTLSTGAGTTGG